MSGDDGLREAVAHRVLGFVKDVVNGGGPSIYDITDAVLALPEIAALRADAEKWREAEALRDAWPDLARIPVAELAALRAKAAAADRVRELHEGVVNWDAPECEACSTYDDDGCSYIAPWPCPTIRALDGSTLC